MDYLINTNLKVDATLKDIEKICDEANKYHLDKVCIQPYYLPLAYSLLENSTVLVEVAISYPSGLNTLNTKSYEAIEAINNKASGVLLNINLAAIKNQDFDYVKEEIEEIRDSIDGKDVTVLLNTDYLTEEEIVEVVNICNDTFINEIALEGDNLENTIKIINQHKIELLEIRINKDVNKQELDKFISLGVKHIGISSIEKVKEN